MSLRVERGCCGRDERCTGITQTSLNCPPFSAADGHDPMPCFASLNQKLLSSTDTPPPPLPIIAHSYHPSGQPAPPREIPERSWNTLLSPRSQSDCWVIPVYEYVLSQVCKSKKTKHSFFLSTLNESDSKD